MGSIKYVTEVVGALILVMMLGCASSGNLKEEPRQTSNSSTITVDDPTIALADYLRKVAGVSVQGSGNNIRVYVRGANTISGSNQALFVVDGSRVGRSYDRVSSIIAVDNIDSIQVLKGSEAGARYGLEGGGGVIEIKTKRN